MAEEEKTTKSIDKASLELIEKAAKDEVNTAFDRADAMKPCPIGSAGSCCKHCGMGPCRVPLPKGKEETPEEKQKRRGICGATSETIAARNFIRMVAGGASAHSDHGRGVAELFLAVARGKAPGYEIKDEQKLLQLALDWGIEIGDRSNNEIAIDIGEKALAEFGNQEGELITLKKAPLKRQELWRQQGVAPRGIDREIVEIMHRTHIGVDQDYENLLTQGVRAAIGDGWGGSMIATELQDILFGTPAPILGKANLGVLKADEVNIIIHGHEPLLSEMIVAAAQEPEMIEMAKSKGASGINLSGMCCTANEILMRHGVAIAGNFLQQELAIVTGAVDAMVVDVQCIMQSIQTVAECYHTKIITTAPKAKIPGATHIEFNEHDALKSAREIVKTAIENFPNRKANVAIPEEQCDQIAGFSHETINYLLGGMFRASYRPLNDNIINGRIRGVAGVVGCNNARVKHNEGHVNMVKELIKNDVLVITTGCNAIACAEAGLLVPEAAAKYAGEGLAEVCETVGIPPVLHMGSCVDNSRILIAATAMVKDGGLGDDISDLPVAGAAPEWMSEKAISIGQYFVASGVYTVFGVTWPTEGSKEVTEYLFKDMEEKYGGMWDFEPDPIQAAHKMIAHIDKKRKALGIDKARERVLYDMEMRRELEG
ncbi:MAG: anaerobic carbon-monoxide dehydrogenase catalytic subunit [Dehalococcoidales bacterium]|jgi:carbon-monoxide dehydrogenase catalytic subunit|nr:anaerobic carbon-monoxide dehydrogenase catalytic subunit [Dehalococcoidales bacterium]